MARLVTAGFAIADNTSVSAGRLDLDFQTNDTTNVNNQTSVVRPGDDGAMEIVSSTGRAVSWFGTGVDDVRYYCRFYYRFDSNNTAQQDFFRFLSSAGGTLVKLNISTSQVVTLRDAGGTLIGSGVTLSAGQWYCIEVMMRNGTSANTDECELRVDQVSIASTTTNNAATVSPSGVQFGTTVAGSGSTQYFGAFAVNDDTGANQNSWPGAGNVKLLRAVSDAQIGTWTGGAGGTSNLFNAIDDTPPNGTASETDTTQIESTDDSGDNSADEYRANLTSYTNAGITSADLITVLHPNISHGEDSATGTKTGSFGMQDNPSQSYATFTFGDDVGALGTWPTNWRWRFGDPIYLPTVTLASNPVIAVRTTNSAASAVRSVAFMGAYVEYVLNGAPVEPSVMATRRIRSRGGSW